MMAVPVSSSSPPPSPPGTESANGGAGDPSDPEHKRREVKLVSVPVANFYKTLSQFALIGLCRVNALLGDYTSALRALEPIDLNSNKRSPFSQYMSAHFTLYYYMGLSYVMLRRYVDAARTLSSFLTHVVGRHDDSHPRLLGKRVEQMYGLLYIAVSLAHYPLNNTLQTALRDKFPEKQTRMNKGELAVFDEVFDKSCPQFITAATPNYALKINTELDARQHQKRIFLNDISERASLPEILSYLKLCSTVSVSRLASFLKWDEAKLIQELLALKHKTRNMQWRPGGSGVGGGPLAGKLTSAAELNFAMSRDVMHVAEYRTQSRYPDYFVRKSLRLEEIIYDINHVDIK